MSGCWSSSSTLRCGKRPLAMPYWMTASRLAQNAVAEPAPAGNVEIGELRAVGLDLRVDRVGPMQMADRGAGIDRADILLRHRIEAARRRVAGIRRIRHRRIAGDRDDELFQRLLLILRFFARAQAGSLTSRSTASGIFSPRVSLRPSRCIPGRLVDAKRRGFASASASSRSPGIRTGRARIERRRGAHVIRQPARQLLESRLRRDGEDRHVGALARAVVDRVAVQHRGEHFDEERQRSAAIAERAAERLDRALRRRVEHVWIAGRRCRPRREDSPPAPRPRGRA